MIRAILERSPHGNFHTPCSAGTSLALKKLLVVPARCPRARSALQRRGRSRRVMRASSGRERRMTAHHPHLPHGQPTRVLAELNVNKLHGMAHSANIIRIRLMDSCMTWHTSACCTRSRALFAVSPGHIFIDTVVLARLGDAKGCAKQENRHDHQRSKAKQAWP